MNKELEEIVSRLLQEDSEILKAHLQYDVVFEEAVNQLTELIQRERESVLRKFVKWHNRAVDTLREDDALWKALKDSKYLRDDAVEQFLSEQKGTNATENN
jgi:hypothetical protein